ncbi:TasA family protein [Salarchaeum sp. III]|uniref:TasA family protein n=1 Tax=Salarchaeum sp. III TaxID=3107927 RepID=UPI002ED9574A
MSDDTDGIELTRRRALGGLLTLGAAGAAGGAGTMAYFSDTETSTGNTVSAGTMNLELGAPGGTYGDGVSGVFSVGNLAPGDTLGGTVVARNDGSLAADHLELKIGASGTEASGNGSDDGDTMPESADGMASLFEVDTLSYPEETGGGELVDNLDGDGDLNDNGIVDLDDIVRHGVFNDLQPAPQAGISRDLTMDLEFVNTDRPDYTGDFDDDDFQGDELSITVTMALAQEPGQDVL